MKRKLGPLETQFFAYTQMRGLSAVSSSDLTALGLSAVQQRKVLSRLARAGIIARVRRGLYLVPPRLPLGGAWSPDEALALATLVRDRRGRYQICGPNAFSRYGFTDQIPTRVYAYNNRISGERRVGAVALTLIKVATGRLGETDVVRTAAGLNVPYSSRARTLVDAVYDWSRFNSLPQAFDWIRTDLRTRRTRASDLVKATLRYGDMGAIRRIGALLEREGASKALLKKMDRRLSQSQSLIPWNPVRPKRGPIDRRWGVVWNERA